MSLDACSTHDFLIEVPDIRVQGLVNITEDSQNLHHEEIGLRNVALAEAFPQMTGGAPAGAAGSRILSTVSAIIIIVIIIVVIIVIVIVINIILLLLLLIIIIIISSSSVRRPQCLLLILLLVLMIMIMILLVCRRSRRFFAATFRAPFASSREDSFLNSIGEGDGDKIAANPVDPSQ